MRVLLIGSGGREHALAWAIASSPSLTRLFVAPGNGGVEAIATCVALRTECHNDVIEFCQSEAIDLVVVGPEAPLVAGLVDDLAAHAIRAFGPSAAAAQLEGSKLFTKELCDEAGIPTAAYAAFSDRDAALRYVEDHSTPMVIKADGLAGGKGVTIAETVAIAADAVNAAFDGVFGTAGTNLVIEECLFGEEASFFALTDGTNILPLASAQDHKRIFDGDRGPNTGGMGAYSPAPVMTPEIVETTISRIVRPTVSALAARGTPFRGVLYAGLMICADGPKLIEYNVRFGDPECQVLIMRLQSDLLELINATLDGTLDRINVRWREQAALTVVMAANGYPGAYETGSPIAGLEQAGADPHVQIFHAGTRRTSDGIAASGGRVLNVTALGDSVAEARERVYAAIEKIDWPDCQYRHDIGWRAIERRSG